MKQKLLIDVRSENENENEEDDDADDDDVRIDQALVVRLSSSKIYKEK